jgi:hypothetical protein
MVRLLQFNQGFRGQGSEVSGRGTGARDQGSGAREQRSGEVGGKKKQHQSFQTVSNA